MQDFMLKTKTRNETDGSLSRCPKIIIAETTIYFHKINYI